MVELNRFRGRLNVRYGGVLTLSLFSAISALNIAS